MSTTPDQDNIEPIYYTYELVIEDDSEPPAHNYVEEVNHDFDHHIILPLPFTYATDSERQNPTVFMGLPYTFPKYKRRMYNFSDTEGSYGGDDYNNTSLTSQIIPPGYSAGLLSSLSAGQQNPIPLPNQAPYRNISPQEQYVLNYQRHLAQQSAYFTYLLSLPAPPPPSYPRPPTPPSTSSYSSTPFYHPVPSQAAALPNPSSDLLSTNPRVERKPPSPELDDQEVVYYRPVAPKPTNAFQSMPISKMFSQNVTDRPTHTENLPARNQQMPEQSRMALLPEIQQINNYTFRYFDAVNTIYQNFLYNQCMLLQNRDMSTQGRNRAMRSRDMPSRGRTIITQGRQKPTRSKNKSTRARNTTTCDTEMQTQLTLGEDMPTTHTLGGDMPTRFTLGGDMPTRRGHLPMRAAEIPATSINMPTGRNMNMRGLDTRMPGIQGGSSSNTRIQSLPHGLLTFPEPMLPTHDAIRKTESSFNNQTTRQNNISIPITPSNHLVAPDNKDFNFVQNNENIRNYIEYSTQSSLYSQFEPESSVPLDLTFKPEPVEIVEEPERNDSNDVYEHIPEVYTSTSEEQHDNANTAAGRNRYFWVG